MADIALGVVGAVIGGVVSGGNPQAIMLGWSAGTLIGGALDPQKQKAQSVGKLDDAARRVVGSAYGAVMPISFGTVPIGGNIIWGTDLEEHSSANHHGKGGGGAPTVNAYTYTADLAVSFGRGPRRINRIWLEDILVWDTGAAVGNHTIRIYDGDEAQGVDTRIEAVEGAGEAPAYRGQCYAVFETLLTTAWGNRVPASVRAELEPVGGGTETVQDVLEYLFEEVGVTSGYRDLSGGHALDVVRGYAVANRIACRDACLPILTFASSTLQDADGLIQLVALDASVQGTIPANDIGSALWDDKDSNHAVSKLTGRLLDDLDLPVHADLNYLGESFRGYEHSTASRDRFSKQDTQEKLTIDVPMVLSEDEAAGLVTRLLYEQWKHQEQFNFTLPPRSGLKLVPGDLWNLPLGSGTTVVRIVKTDMPLPIGVLEVEALTYEAGVVTQNASGAGLDGVSDSISLVEDTALIAWSSNALQDDDAGQVGIYVAANGATVGSWPGCTLYMSRDAGLTYQVLDTMADPAAYGETDSTLAAPGSHVGTAIWDDVSTVDVNLTNGTAPATLSDAEVLNGANGVWFETGEVIQYAVATNLGGGVYRLSRLLRGRQGTDPDWSAHSTGEACVFLATGSVKHEALPDDLVNATVLLRAVTAGQDIGAVADVPVTVTGYEWKPWSGNDGRGSLAAGDWTITWERRTRSGGAWADYADADLVDVPEEYELEVWDATYVTLKRTFTGLTARSQVYTSADQTTDFGSPQATIYLRAFQVGRFGRGWAYDFSATSP